MERNGEVGMGTLAHQVTPSRSEWSGGEHVHPPSSGHDSVLRLTEGRQTCRGMKVGIVIVTH